MLRNLESYCKSNRLYEVDFVIPQTEQPYAVEVKYNETSIKQSKYRKFVDSYPDIPLHFAFMEPFDENFFRKNPIINE